MSRDERQAAQNECQVLKLLSHPNVIKYFENFLADKALMIAMEYAPGGTLAEYIQKRGGSLLDEDTILHFFVQIALALHHVHSNHILHRDLKTHNILLDKRQTVVKVGDFGISKILSSKSKAYTVVGTPCYISPELCEGKPYNQKSDIWALGCILYELASLKRAFEAENLPALVLKIMSGNFAPVSDRYSGELRQLVVSLLNLDPGKRPQLSEVLSHPVCMSAMIRLYMDIGRVPARMEKPMMLLSLDAQGRARQACRPRFPLSGDGTPAGSAGRAAAAPPPLSSVYMWGSGTLAPVKLAMPNTEVLQVAVGRTQRAGVTRSGRLIVWEASPGTVGDAALPGSVGSVQPQLVSRFLEGQSGVTIQHVSCGDLFTACLTDRGILMTYGSGSSGCLGHGSYSDVAQPKIVEALLGYEITQVSCGMSHVLAVSNEQEVFAWGRGDNGRLGLGNQELHLCPQPVAVPPPYEPCTAHCGIDCSMILTSSGRLLACGSNREKPQEPEKNPRDQRGEKDAQIYSSRRQESNPRTPAYQARYNKLGLDKISHDGGDDAVTCPTEQTEESLVLSPVQSSPLDGARVVHVALGTAHSAAVTDTGTCYTFGSNQHGQLGGGARTSSRAPQPVDGLGGVKVVQVTCGDAFTVAVAEGGQVFTWGKAARGRLGRTDGEACSPRPVQLQETFPYAVTSVSSRHGNTLLSVHCASQCR
ncbi:serine/threonine-protein kinase Nek8 isoform X1 [Lethenteron reissneri]|uniref:serine/threonine-protein kinase Nek8 isoform X1 n=1 Tax=Lethenteron reissneri TaxID=7753 RepID=UPI002AB6CDF5|nr:serine/threonine-protein kinase Nek8 isoform X1 [Lethenteron reissneri]